MPFKDPEKQEAYWREYRQKNAERNKARCKAWYEANKAYVVAKAAAWTADHPDRARDFRRAHRLKNAEKRKAEAKAYYAANKKRKHAMSREWALQNPERARAASKKWRAAHPERNKLACAKRLARLRDGVSPGVSESAWNSIKESFCGLCAYCLRPCAKPEREHVAPLARGGLDEEENLVPACRACNGSKHARTLLVWLRAGGVKRSDASANVGVIRRRAA